MEFIDLPPMLGAAGSVRLPGSKSISNRVLLLAALAEGETDIRDLLLSDDVERMLEALRALGVDWRREGDSLDYRVRGVGGPFPVKAGELFLGNAGTAFRPLTAALALSGGEYRLSGVPRMHERPIGDLVDALRQLGADIACTANEGYPPLHLKPATIRPGGVVRVRGDVSSQFLTALLMALPLTGVETTIEVVGELISKPYIRITLELMARFGVQVEQQGWERFVVPGGARYRSPGTVFVEGDASSASYFLAAGAIGGGPVRVEGVGRTSIQGDVRFAEALEQLGARITLGDNWIEAAAPAGGVLKAFDLDLNHIPDAAMTLAVAALFADGAVPAAQHRELAGQGDRPHRRHGHRAAQARRRGGGGRRLPGGAAPAAPAAGGDRHLRRPPHGDVLLAGEPGRLPRAHQRPEVREQDLPRLLRGLRAGGAAGAGAGHRRPLGLGQGHGGGARRRGAGLALPRQRLALPPGGAGRDARGRRLRRRGRRGRARRDPAGALRGRAGAARRGRGLRRHRRDPLRGLLGRRLQGRRAGRRCARPCSTASATTARRPAWSPKGATWAR